MMNRGRFSAGGRFEISGKDPDVIEKKSGGGCLAIFGAPFFLAGLFVALIGLGILDSKGGNGLVANLGIGVVGLVFMVVGGILILGRSGWIVDRRQGRIVEWQGLLVPLRRVVHPLDRFAGLRLEGRPDEGSMTWTVQLTGSAAVKELILERMGDEVQARQRAEVLARFLHLPLEEIAQGRRLVREPDRLDESFRDRVRRLKEQMDLSPPPPLTMRTRVEPFSGGVVLTIPGQTTGLRPSLSLAAPLVFAGIVAFVFLPGLLELPAPPVIHLIFVAFIILLGVLLPVLRAVLGFVRATREKTVITATSAFLRWEENKGGRRRTIEIPVDELEDLFRMDRKNTLKGIEMPGMKKRPELGDMGSPRLPDGRPIPKILLSLLKLVPTQGITARSDKTVLTFGAGLPEAELAYLHALIVKAVTE
jgi:hypothetical protein